MDEILKQKQERFKALGIPMPMEKPNLDQPIVNVKDPKMLQRIQEIKNGAKKQEFNEILTVGDNKGFKPLPEPKKKSNPNIKNQNVSAPTLENFAPSKESNELDIYDKLFSADPSVAPTLFKTPSQYTGQRIVQEDVSFDSTGSDFLSNFRQKLQAKAMSNGNSLNSSGFGFTNPKPNDNIHEIEEKIYKISSEVAKKISEETIKNVLDEYLSKKKNLQENTFVKVKDDIIKIDNKYYKLTPVTIKKK